jgi:16S rRNA (uracil1498-N3)-methyltransferase
MSQAAMFPRLAAAGSSGAIFLTQGFPPRRSPPVRVRRRPARSVVHPRDAKLDRLQRHVIEASKQCGRNVLMEIGPLTEWADFLRRDDLPGRKVLAQPGGAKWTPEAGDVVAAVGPEGGFTDDEVEQALAAAWTVVGLGPRVLRVETAAMVLAVGAGFVE